MAGEGEQQNIQNALQRNRFIANLAPQFALIYTKKMSTYKIHTIAPAYTMETCTGTKTTEGWHH